MEAMLILEIDDLFLGVMHSALSVMTSVSTMVTIASA